MMTALTWLHAETVNHVASNRLKVSPDGRLALGDNCSAQTDRLAWLVTVWNGQLKGLYKRLGVQLEQPTAT
jgi:hypothetical protein